MAGRRRGARRLALSLLVGAVLLLTALPAAADPAGPTNYDSVLTGLEAADGEPVPVALEVFGGDSYLALEVEPGVEVEVPGYEGEPYIRIGADGVVEVNERSPARWLNEAVLGAAEVAVPAQADEDADPVWRRVGDGGAYAWHDHRIHWMSAAAPPHVDTAADEPQPVMTWEVPLLVDGREVVATGELTWHPGPPPLLVVALLAITLGAGLALALVRRVPAPVLAGTGGLVTAVVGGAQWLTSPTGADIDPALPVLSLLTLLAAAVGLAWMLRDPGAARGRLLGAASGLPLVIWGVVQAGALTRPLVPGPLPTGVVRAAAALALGLGAAALVVLARDVVQAALGPLDDLPDGGRGRDADGALRPGASRG